MDPEVSHSPSSKKMLLTVILMTSFFNSFMGSAVNIALPQIGKEFSMNAVGLSWVSMAFLLTTAIFLVPVGRFADLRGRRRIFLGGNIIFLLASAMAVLVTGGSGFILARAVQGMGSAMILGTNMAIIAAAYPQQQRGRYIGMTISAVYLGLTLAPVLGGLLTQYLGWRSIFYINIIAGLFIATVLLMMIRKEKDDTLAGSFDYRGSVVYMVAIFFLMYGFSMLPKNFAILFTLIGLIGMLLFVLLELHTEEAVLNMRLFVGNRIFTLSNLAALINYAATFAITFMISLYLQYGKGMSPREAGLVLLAQPAFMALVASFSGRLADKYQSRILASIGMGIIMAGIMMLVFVGQDTSIHYIFSSLMIVGIGFGFFASPNTNAIMGSVEKKYLGVASAMTSTMRSFGMMLSMGIATMIINSMMGNVKLSNNNVGLFIESQRYIFAVFVVLCIIGIFASLVRGTQKMESM